MINLRIKMKQRERAISKKEQSQCQLVFLWKLTWDLAENAHYKSTILPKAYQETLNIQNFLS